MGKVQSRSHKRQGHYNRQNMHDDRDGPSRRDSPDTEYVGSRGDRPATPSTSHLGQVSDSTDAPHQGDSTSGPTEDPSWDPVNYPHTPTPLLAYHRPYGEYPPEYQGSMISGYSYPMYSSSWLYSGMTVPPAPPPSASTDQEYEPDWQGTNTTSRRAAPRLWWPYAAPTHWER